MIGSFHVTSLYISTYTYINCYISMTNNLIVKYDNPEPWGLFFQDNATPQMEALEELHNNIMFYLAIIMFSVTWIFISIILNYTKSRISNKYMNHGTLVELIWTITPALMVQINSTNVPWFINLLDIRIMVH